MTKKLDFNIPRTDQRRIVILGAGFGGLKLAKKLTKTDFQIILIDRNNFHQFQPLFYQVAMAGLEPSSITFPLRKHFQKNDNVFIRIGEVSQIDSKAKNIFADDFELEYDDLVIALGAKTNYYDNDQLLDKTLPLKSVSEALYLRNKILEDYEKALIESDYDKRQSLIDIVIVGGGPTGVELAGALAEMKSFIVPKDYKELNADEIDIHLIQGAEMLLYGMSPQASIKAEEYLTNLGVQIKKNTFVKDFDGFQVYLSDDTTIQTNKVIWAAGVTSEIIKGLDPTSYGHSNRLIVDRYLKVKNYENIYAIGDIAYMETKQYPKAHPQVAQVAMQQASRLAANLIKAKPELKRKFKYKDLGTLATIGRNRAVADLPKLKFQGFFAWLMWLFVHLFQLIGARNRLVVFINWIWSYITYDQSLRLIIKPKKEIQKEVSNPNA